MATNPTKPGPAGDDGTLGPQACRAGNLADRRNDNHATPPTAGPNESRAQYRAAAARYVAATSSRNSCGATTST